VLDADRKTEESLGILREYGLISSSKTSRGRALVVNREAARREAPDESVPGNWIGFNW
jgi:hypothetical protein